MAFVDTTFFGEVSDLRSRAIWSDSEDEQEEDVQAVESRLVFENLDISSFKQVFVTVGSAVNPKASVNFVGKVILERNQSTFAVLKRISSSVGWLVIDEGQKKRDDSSLVENIAQLLKTSFSNQPNAKVFVISSQFTNADAIEYLAAIEGSQVAIPKSAARRLLPPTMVTEVIEAAIFQWFALRSLPCCLYLIPDSRLTNFDLSSSGLPKEIIDSFDIKHLTADNNIYV